MNYMEELNLLESNVGRIRSIEDAAIVCEEIEMIGKYNWDRYFNGQPILEAAEMDIHTINCYKSCVDTPICEDLMPLVCKVPNEDIELKKKVITRQININKLLVNNGIIMVNSNKDEEIMNAAIKKLLSDLFQDSMDNIREYNMATIKAKLDAIGLGNFRSITSSYQREASTIILNIMCGFKNALNSFDLVHFEYSIHAFNGFLLATKIGGLEKEIQKRLRETYLSYFLVKRTQEENIDYNKIGRAYKNIGNSIELNISENNFVKHISEMIEKELK